MHADTKAMGAHCKHNKSASVLQSILNLAPEKAIENWICDERSCREFLGFSGFSDYDILKIKIFFTCGELIETN